MYQTKIDLGYDPIGSYTNVNPFTTAFCRTEKHGNVLVTGGLNEIEKYIEGNLGRTLASLRLWHKGRNRGYERLYNCGDKKVVHMRGKIIIFTMQGNIAEYGRVPYTFPRILRTK